jgi:DNA-binding MarR family transcriptional regulator
MSRKADVEALMDAMRRFQHVRERFIAARMRTSDGAVETAAFACLFVLDHGPARSGAVAEKLYTDPSTVSRHVANLVKLGYVRREADPDDGRATILVITDLGRKRVGQLRAQRTHSMLTAMEDWSDADLHTLSTLYRRFVDQAEETAWNTAVEPVQDLEEF